VLAHNGVHDPVVLLAVGGPVDVDAVPAGILLKRDQVPVEVGKRVRFDLRSLFPQRFPLGQAWAALSRLLRTNQRVSLCQSVLASSLMNTSEAAAWSFTVLWDIL
jgi:hypothetical protein